MDLAKWPPDIGIEPYYADKYRVIYHGDCLDVLAGASPVFSAVVTDPPYGLGFMGKSWDTFDKSQFGRKGSEGVNDLKVKKNFEILPRYNSGGLYEFALLWARLCRVVALPGAPLLSFGGSRTQHRIACAIEDAGWELRDVLMWVYATGFPKSLDIGKAIDKVKGVAFSSLPASGVGFMKPDSEDWHQTKNQLTRSGESTPEAQLWDGYGTALKPAYEPIILAMNPVDKTFANNALLHGVAGLNIDACRVGLNGEGQPSGSAKRVFANNQYNEDKVYGDNRTTPAKGRFPANFLHDGSEEVLELFPHTKSGVGAIKRRTAAGHQGNAYGVENRPEGTPMVEYGDNGSAARFFYCAKASRSERDSGLSGNGRNTHPTVKPLALMTYLCRLVKMPEYNLILDPFCGSGTTLLACGGLGIRSIGIDSDEKSCEIAANRCAKEAVDSLRRGEY